MTRRLLIASSIYNGVLRLLAVACCAAVLAACHHDADAPATGSLRRVVVVDVGDGLIELINPEIIAREGEQGGAEGCLSIPGRQGYVVRPERVTVRAQDRKGKPIEVIAEGFKARAFCHEIDHLDGVLYIDKMDHEIFDDEEK